MGNTVACIEIAQSGANTRDEVDALLDVLPGSVLGKSLKTLNRRLLPRHDDILARGLLVESSADG